MTACSVDGCARPRKARGLCNGHYCWFQRNGTQPTHRLRPDVPVAERFLAKVAVDADSGCWLWTGSINNHTGYGRFHFQGTGRDAHPIAYRLFVGEVPDGLELDHLCRVRHCVNPEHLDPVTHAENMRRAGIALREAS